MQFRTKRLLIAEALLAAAAGMSVLAADALLASKMVPLAVGLFAIQILLAAAIGVFIGRVWQSPAFGWIVGLLVVAAALQSNVGIAIFVLVAIVLWLRRDATPRPIKQGEPTYLRQQSIYRLSAICCLTEWFIWLPIVFADLPNKECRPMGQAMVEGLFIYPATLVLYYGAIKQLINTWPGRRGWIALGVALLPLATYIVTQWLILTVCGISYED